MKTITLLIKHPILFILGSILYSATFVVVFSLIGIGLGFDPQMVGRALAPVVLIICIPAGGSFVAFVQNKKSQQASISNPISRLNSPQKRMMFLLCLFGLGLMLFAYVLLGDSATRFSRHILVPLREWQYVDGVNFLSLLLFWFGLVLFFCCLAFSFAYEQTIGKLLQWVRG